MYTKDLIKIESLSRNSLTIAFFIKLSVGKWKLVIKIIFVKQTKYVCEHNDALCSLFKFFFGETAFLKQMIENWVSQTWSNNWNFDATNRLRTSFLLRELKIMRSEVFFTGLLVYFLISLNDGFWSIIKTLSFIMGWFLFLTC